VIIAAVAFGFVLLLALRAVTTKWRAAARRARAAAPTITVAPAVAESSEGATILFLDVQRRRRAGRITPQPRSHLAP